MRFPIPQYLCLLLVPGLVLAQNPSSAARGELTLPDALARALADSPTLRAETLQVRAAEARALTAGLRPPLALSTDLENFAGSDDLSGADALEATLRLSAVIELGERRSRRRDVAERERDAAALGVERKRLEVLADVATRFVDTAAAQESVAMRRAETQLAQATLAAVERRIEIGAAPRFELGRARIALTQARIREEHAEHEVASTSRRLAALLGERDPSFASVRADLYSLPRAGPFEQLSVQLERNPDLEVLAAEERIASARVRLAQATRRPEVNVSVGVRHLQTLDDTALVAGFSMPLGTAKRAQLTHREAAARRDRSVELRLASRLQLEALLYELTLELQHARLELDSLRGSVLADALSVLQEVERGFRQGRFAFQDYALAQSQLSETRLGAIEAAARFHRLLIEIERLTGAPAIPAPERE